MTEVVLPYDQSVVPQQTSWWCGPASCQVILNSRGTIKTERDLMLELERLEGNNGWDDQDGTDSIAQVATVLNRYVDGGYLVRQMPNDPPTQAQKDLLWDDVVKSVDAGFGVVGNIAVPWSNFPKGTRGSVTPSYTGNFVWHYLSIMGYADDGPGGKHYWIADSGFKPFGYWCSADQMASMIASKGYCAKPVGGGFLSALSESERQEVLVAMRQLGKF